MKALRIVIILASAAMLAFMAYQVFTFVRDRIAEFKLNRACTDHELADPDEDICEDKDG